MAASGYGTFLEEKAQFLHRRRLRKRSSISTPDWMSKVADHVLMSSLSIPGTHDSAAYTSIWPFVSTQKMNIIQQLDAGIRYFDFRCGLVDNIPQMVHGRAVLGLRLELVLDMVYTWLDAHSHEAIIIQIKQDRKEEESEVHFPVAIYSLIDASPQYWRTIPTTPTVGEIRGKIQLFRRFGGPPWRGIDVSRWQDNPSIPFTIYTHHGIRLTIQDHYNPRDPAPLPDFIAEKGGNVSQLLDQASSDTDASKWYINFASAFEFNLYYQVSPREVALGGIYNFQWITGINPRLDVYIKQHAADMNMTRRRYGIVAMDFPEQEAKDLVRSIIASNFGKREEKSSWGIVYVAIMLFLVFVGGVALILIHGPVRRPWCPPTLLHSCHRILG